MLPLSAATMNTVAMSSDARTHSTAANQAVENRPATVSSSNSSTMLLCIRDCLRKNTCTHSVHFGSNHVQIDGPFSPTNRHSIADSTSPPNQTHKSRVKSSHTARRLHSRHRHSWPFPLSRTRLDRANCLRMPMYSLPTL